MGVPLLDTTLQNLPLEAELTDAFVRVLRSGKFILGEEVEAFEQEVADLVGAGHAIGVSSGTDALLAALMALGIGPGDEVICPAFTFFATAGSIARVGAVPVFADSCPVCFNIDVGSVRDRITERTKAILPVHLFGQSADMDSVGAFAAEFGLKVIEDAAQAIGASYRGRPCGVMGDLGTFSFFPSKNLGGFGDGGMVVTSDDDLAERVRIVRSHGSKSKYLHHVVGGNFRIDALQAALLRVKLPHYARYTENRRRNAAFYDARLSGLPGVVRAAPEDCRCAGRQTTRLADSGARLVLPVEYPHCRHIWNQYTLRVLGDGERERFRSVLSAQGIGTEIYYPVTMDRQDCFADLGPERSASVRVAHALAAECVSIPIFPELREDQLAEVASAVERFLGI